MLQCSRKNGTASFKGTSNIECHMSGLVHEVAILLILRKMCFYFSLRWHFWQNTWLALVSAGSAAAVPGWVQPQQELRQQAQSEQALHPHHPGQEQGGEGQWANDKSRTFVKDMVLLHWTMLWFVNDQILLFNWTDWSISVWDLHQIRSNHFIQSDRRHLSPILSCAKSHIDKVRVLCGWTEQAKIMIYLFYLYSREGSTLDSAHSTLIRFLSDAWKCCGLQKNNPFNRNLMNDLMSTSRASVVWSVWGWFLLSKYII